MFELEFRGPYVSLIESFGEPEEPFRTIEGLAFVQFRHGGIRGQSLDGKTVYGCLAKIEYDEDFGVAFVTSDGQKWSEATIQRTFYDWSLVNTLTNKYGERYEALIIAAIELLKDAKLGEDFNFDNYIDGIIKATQ